MSYQFFMIDPNHVPNPDDENDTAQVSEEMDVCISYNYAPILYSEDCFGNKMNEDSYADYLRSKTGAEVAEILNPIIDNLLWIGNIDFVTCNEANVKQSLIELRDMCLKYPDAVLDFC